MIKYIGRNPETNCPIVEKDGVSIMWPAFRPSRRRRVTMHCHTMTKILLRHWFGPDLWPRKRKDTLLISASLFPGKSGLLRKGFTISEEREAELKELATAMLVAEKLRGTNLCPLTR